MRDRDSRAPRNGGRFVWQSCQAFGAYDGVVVLAFFVSGFEPWAAGAE